MSDKILFTWHLDFLPSFRFLIKYKTVSAIMHLLFLQIATQSFLLVWGFVTWHSFFLSFFALSCSLIIPLSMIYLFYFFFNLLDKSRSTNYLALSLLLIAFLYESSNLTFISVQLAMHISFVRKKEVYCYSLLSPWGLESLLKLHRNFYVCFWISVLM